MNTGITHLIDRKFNNKENLQTECCAIVVAMS